MKVAISLRYFSHILILQIQKLKGWSIPRVGGFRTHLSQNFRVHRCAFAVNINTYCKTFSSRAGEISPNIWTLIKLGRRCKHFSLGLGNYLSLYHESWCSFVLSHHKTPMFSYTSHCVLGWGDSGTWTSACIKHSSDVSLYYWLFSFRFCINIIIDAFSF